MIRWAAALLLCAATLRAQPAAAVHSFPLHLSIPCSYETCALGIAPAWNGLDVVLGATGARVASLGFFLPRDIAPTFAGSDSAMRYAVRAVSVRRVAAVAISVPLQFSADGLLSRAVWWHNARYAR